MLKKRNEEVFSPATPARKYAPISMMTCGRTLTRSMMKTNEGDAPALIAAILATAPKTTPPTDPFHTTMKRNMAPMPKRNAVTKQTKSTVRLFWNIDCTLPDWYISWIFVVEMRLYWLLKR